MRSRCWCSSLHRRSVPPTRRRRRRRASRPTRVFIEELTWAEVRDLVKAGTTTVIIGTAGTEQKGPHMVDGEHKFVMEWTRRQDRARDRQDAGRAGRHLRARRQLGKPRRPHGQAGHDHAARRSVRRAAGQRRPQPEGRRLQDHPVHRRIGRQSQRHADGRRQAERAVEGRRRDGVLDRRLLHKGARRSEQVGHRARRHPGDQIGNHANILDTSELLFVNAEAHPQATGCSGNDYENNGVSGNNQSKSTPELGKALLQIKIDNAVAQIKGLMAGTSTPAAVQRARRRRGRRRAEARGGGGRGGRGNADRADHVRADDGYGAGEQDTDARRPTPCSSTS